MQFFRAEKGDLLIKLNKYDGALSAIDTALSLKPDDGGIWNLKGIALDYLGRHEEAKAARENRNKSVRDKDSKTIGKTISDNILKLLKENAQIVTSKDINGNRAKDLSDTFTLEERVFAVTKFTWDISLGSPKSCNVQVKWYNGDQVGFRGGHR